MKESQNKIFCLTITVLCSLFWACAQEAKQPKATAATEASSPQITQAKQNPSQEASLSSNISSAEEANKQQIVNRQANKTGSKAKSAKPIIVKRVLAENKRDEKLETYLKDSLKDWASGSKNYKVTYSYNHIDLNDDGTPEIVVYTEGDFCGTGGCITEVISQQNGKYENLATFGTTWGSFVVSTQKTNGWRDIVTYISSGGVAGEYLLVKFDGKTYPKDDAPELNAPVRGVEYLTGNSKFAFDAAK
jgi:hypothetical protein